MTTPTFPKRSRRWKVGLPALVTLMLLFVLFASATFREGQNAQAAPPDKKGNDRPPYEYQSLDMTAENINEDGAIAGDGFLIIPEDKDGDGRPDCWYQDDDGDGQNDLLIPVPPLDEFEGWNETYAMNSKHAVGVSVVLTPGASPSRSGRAFLWSGGAMTALEAFGSHTVGWTSAATDINSQGQVVGWVYDRWVNWPENQDNFGFHGFLINPLDTDEDGVPETWFVDNGSGGNALMIDLQLPPNSFGYFDLRINEAGRISTGVVAGVIDPVDSDGDGRVETWVRDDNSDGMNDLLILLPGLQGDEDVVADDLNANGAVVGWSGDSAVVWQVNADGTVLTTTLPSPKAPRGWSVSRTSAKGVNDSGQICGAVTITENGRNDLAPTRHAGCVWRDGKVVLLTEFDYSSMWAINNRGEMIGNYPGFVAIPSDP